MRTDSTNKNSLGVAQSKSLKTDFRVRAWINCDAEDLSVREQCRLLGFHRSGIYYEPQPETDENLRIMRLLNEEHMRHPASDSRQLVDFLEWQGMNVNRKRSQRLMLKIGIEGISPKR